MGGYISTSSQSFTHIIIITNNNKIKTEDPIVLVECFEYFCHRKLPSGGSGEREGDQDWEEKEFQFGIILLSTLSHSAQHRGESDQIDQTTLPLETLYFPHLYATPVQWLIFVIGATQALIYTLHKPQPHSIHSTVYIDIPQVDRSWRNVVSALLERSGSSAKRKEPRHTLSTKVILILLS